MLTTRIVLNIPLSPVAWARAGMNFKNRRIYTPAKTAHYEAQVRMAFQQKIAEGPPVTIPMDSPVELHLTFVMPRPKNIRWKNRPQPREPHIKRPDLDNLEKAVKDALTGQAWNDDSQVYFVMKKKVIGAGTEVPHLFIVIEYGARHHFGYLGV